MVDRYTKAVLTVIAGALVTLAAQNAIGTGRASFDPVTKVQICGAKGWECIEPSQHSDRVGGLTLTRRTLPVSEAK
jgi:hypothetical protein